MRNYGKNTKNKAGIAMVTLIITIVVAIVLAAVGIVTINDSITDATTTAFANDLNTIEDQVKMYYLQNDEFPVLEEEEVLSQNEVINLVNVEEKKKVFEEELTLNGDNNENGDLGAFYKIDISKLNVEKTIRGMKKEGNEADVYVVSYPSMNVYYLEGLKVKGNYYFSLSSKIVEYVKVAENENEDTSTTELLTVGNISVKKTNKTWTNKFGIKLNAYINAGESMYVFIGEEYKFKTNVGNNTYIFDKLEELKSSLEIADETAYDEEVTTWHETNNKKLNVYIKNASGEKLDNMEIDLSNYDYISPVAESFEITETSEKNILTFKVTDEESGAKEVRYDYLQKYNSNGELEKYYKGVESLDTYFLKARGKKAKITKEGNVEISIPKEIEGMQIIVIDKAGNITEITKGISADYVGCKLTSITKEGLKFKVAIVGKNETSKVQSYRAKVSTNKVDYIGEYEEVLTTPERKYVKEISEYKEGVSIEDKVYVKISVTIVENSETREVEGIYEFSIDDKIEEEIPTEQPTIPNGFEYLEGTVDTGFVIKNTEDGNEFVWVPVAKGSFVRESFTQNALSSYCVEPYVENLTSEEATKEINEYNAMMTSVEKYGGFYIGRYEASYNNTTKKVESLKNKIPYETGGSGWEPASRLSREVYPLESATVEKDVVSTLPYGVQWDATVRWMKINYPNILEESIFYGNYTENLINTGSVEHLAINNIYDMAGNMWEWTNEGYNYKPDLYNYRIVRGGGYTRTVNSYNYELFQTRFFVDIDGFGSSDFVNITGFRFALYMI